MALSGLHQFVVKYRNRTGDDLNHCLINLCRLLSSFSTIDKQTEQVVVALRELYLILQLSRTERRVPENVASLFLTALRDLKAIHPQVLTLAVACLAEICPTAALKIDVNGLDVVDVNRLAEFLHLLRQQNLSEEFDHDVCVFLVKCLNDAVTTVAGKKAVLVFLARQFRAGSDGVLFQDCFDMLCWSVSNWLVNASVFDDFQQEKNKRSTKTLALLSVTELDGSTPSELFTVLSLAKSYAEDQQMNILSFALLYEILEALPLREAMEEAEGDGPLGMALATVQGRVRAESIEDVAFEYCLHVLKQSEIRPLKSSYDCELQDAVLSESIRILDLLCLRNPKLVRKAFRAVADLNDRAMRRIHNSMVLLHVFQFMLNHGESASFEVDNMSHFLCCDLLPNAGLLDNIFASEFIALLRQNKVNVQSRTKIFQRYFPAVLKVLAWNPRANMHLYMELMSAMVTPATCLELLHSLIDLPCVSAALEVAIFGEKSFLIAIRQLAAERVSDPRLRYSFDFFLRNESGRGGMMENIPDFHRSLSEVVSHPRVIFCSQAVPALLSIFFSVAVSTKQLDKKSVVLAVLGRMHSLYGSFAENVQMQQVMGDGVCLLLSKSKAIFVEMHNEISDYIVANHFMYPVFLTSLIWCIGEESPALAEKQAKALGKFYDAVESLTYDIIKTKSSNLVHNPQDGIMELFQACLRTMTKLGSLSYDLTRRAVICLNNVVKKTREHPEQQRFDIVDQINSLIKMLALPSVTEIVMNLSISPEPEVLEAIKNLKSVEEEREELILGQSL